MYKAMELANYILQQCIDNGTPITNLQLHKVLFYIQREFLLKVGVEAFEEDIQAWSYGPIVPDVYFKLYMFGGMPITWINGEVATIEKHHKKIIDGIINEKNRPETWEYDDELDCFKGNKEVIPVEVIKGV